MVNLGEGAVADEEVEVYGSTGGLCATAGWVWDSCGGSLREDGDQPSDGSLPKKIAMERL